jgi:hypothetical protein
MTNFLDEHNCKNSQKYIYKPNSTTLNKLYIMIKLDSFLGCKDGSIYAGQ